jgi:putative flippase GtrA
VLRRQLLGYGLVGGLQLLADWLCFVALTSVGAAVVPSNLAGRVLGASMGFWLNGRFTFAAKGAPPRLGGGPLRRFVVFWLAMTALSTLAVHQLDALQGLHGAWLGKPLVEAVLAVISFIAAKYWIYR